jgi:hypothetical protein
MNKPCVRTLVAVRRVQRHPLARKTLQTGIRLQKHFVRGATLGVLPSGINDVVFHHAQLNMDEAIHLVIDQASISSMSAIIAVILIASKFAAD